jgi:hypothetical protein
LDWSGRNIRTIFVGQIGGGCAQALIKVWSRTKSDFVQFFDYWDATGYESAYRVDTVDWVKKNPGKLVETHVISRSKILNMAVSVASLAVPSVMVKSYGKRAEFDILAKKAGLPLNPPMPQLVAPKQF